MNDRKMIGQAIREARIKKNITQKKLAFMTGSHESFICRVEKGSYSTTIDFISNILDKLELKIDINEI